MAATAAEEKVEEEGKQKTRKSIRSRYLTFLNSIANKPVKVRIPEEEFQEGHGEKITPIPLIKEKNQEEVELIPLKEPYSYARIKYDTIPNEYLYELIEPPLSMDENSVLTKLKETLVSTINMSDAEEKEEREKILKKATLEVMHALDISLNPVSMERIFYYLSRDLVGLGTIEGVMLDSNVEDISCDGVNIPIFIFHRKYGSIRSNIKFEKENDLDAFVVWLAQRSGKTISVANPMLDATLPDGSRLNATLGKHVTKKGSSFTIRRFKDDPFTPIDLVRFKTMSIDMMAYLWLCIEYGSSMMVCGGTASGKTTTLNAVLLFIPPQMKIISIEDTRELNLPHENWIASVTREGFGGKSSGQMAGAVDMFDLLTAAMRQRPQYLMVGEVRGKEAYVVFQAMATGTIAYSTFHADDLSSMIHRMESEPINLPRSLMTALNIMLLQGQVKVGTKMTRRVKSLTEIVGLDPETNEIIYNSVFTWNPADDRFHFSGHSYIFEKIRLSRGWSPRQMENEMRRRVLVLEYMRKKNFNNYRKVASLISAYYRDPEKTVAMIESEMAEMGAIQVPVTSQEAKKEVQ
ncbi:MAG: type II/IV secretion system ATPase subunit [Thermoplasmata archaeon]|uniref:Type II/IV secretion system ATPase subunit n=1 Tax=Candidatus Sysuiplasma superficiale TaxID=2823368 RepID=A0A8J7YSI8_9ARCH|nr:type II/IV secretion system ATPase subunit [Candidatus Sysuiplasma superficiale]